MAKRYISGNTKIDPQKLATWLENKWMGEKRCPICKSNNWSISEKALELREWSVNSFIDPGISKIVAMLQCLVCGNTIFINPFIADLFEDEEEAAYKPKLPKENQR